MSWCDARTHARAVLESFLGDNNSLTSTKIYFTVRIQMNTLQAKYLLMSLTGRITAEIE